MTLKESTLYPSSVSFCKPLFFLYPSPQITFFSFFFFLVFWAKPSNALDLFRDSLLMGSRNHTGCWKSKLGARQVFFLLCYHSSPSLYVSKPASLTLEVGGQSQSTVVKVLALSEAGSMSWHNIWFPAPWAPLGVALKKTRKKEVRLL